MSPNCNDYDWYNIINNTDIAKHLINFLDETYLQEQYHIAIECILVVFCVVLFLKKPTQQIYQPLSYIARLINLSNTNTEPPDIQLTTMQRLMGEDENNFNDACIPSVFCVVLILKKQKQQIYQSLSYIKRLIDLNIQVPTMHRLMGEDENNFNETDETMIVNGDGVGMSNCGFRQDNQIPNATQDTPKLCISGSRIAT